jgi:hypothetical protein
MPVEPLIKLSIDKKDTADDLSELPSLCRRGCRGGMLIQMNRTKLGINQHEGFWFPPSG